MPQLLLHRAPRGCSALLPSFRHVNASQRPWRMPTSPSVAWSDTQTRAPKRRKLIHSVTRQLSTKPVDSTRSVRKYKLSKEEARKLLSSLTFEDAPENLNPRATWQKPQEVVEEDFGPTSEENAQALRELQELLDEPDSSHETIYDAYVQLSLPRAGQIPRTTLNRLLDRLSLVEHKSEPSMMRFMAVVEDVQGLGRYLLQRHWNSSLAFVGRCFKQISSARVDYVLSIWHEMENTAKVKSDRVTFNILFDMATKAKMFALAETIQEEMAQRKIGYTRYFWTSLIHHHGLRGNTEKVRQTYLDLVDAGEIVDTVIVNCVIAALYLCGEPSLAEQTFERAKAAHFEHSSGPPPQHSWQERKELGNRLQRLAGVLRKQRVLTVDPSSPASNPESEPLDDQEESPLEVTSVTSPSDASLGIVAPDVSTYKLLIYWHSVRSGDIDRVAALVDEMEDFGFPVPGSIYLYLFKAFANHGGVLYTQWTLQRLENTWSSFMASLNSEDDRLVFVSPLLGFHAARAFYKCADAVRAAEAWAILRGRLRLDYAHLLKETDEQVASAMGDDRGMFEWGLQRQLRR